MNQEREKQVEILFQFHSELLEQEIKEKMLAVVDDEDLGYYKIESIPAYTPGIATGDIVQAEYDDTAEMLTYMEKVKASGNSVIWVVIVDDETLMDDVQETFYNLHCNSVAISERFFTMEVNAEINYLRIKNKLIELRAAGAIDFAEACLSEDHQY